MPLINVPTDVDLNVITQLAAAIFDKLSSNDVVSILVFGVLYLIFGYGVVFFSYSHGIKKVMDGQANLVAVIGEAMIMQIASLIFIWFIILSLSFFSKFSSATSMSYGSAVSIFFIVDWLNVDLNSVLNNFLSNNQPIATIGLLIFIQSLWVFMTVILIMLPLVIILSFVFFISKKYLEKKLGETNPVNILTDLMVMLGVTLAIFTIHFLLPSVFLDGLAKDNATEISKFTSGVQLLDGFDYQDRVKIFIESSLAATNNDINTTN